MSARLNSSNHRETYLRINCLPFIHQFQGIIELLELNFRSNFYIKRNGTCAIGQFKS